jgi:PhzF family phenazine biosynthesis protein
MQVRVVNAFVDGERGGNPAGVVLQADALSAAQKQAIAAQVGLSETAFVSCSQSAAFKLEFFTPTRQIAHCGHATVAAFSLLRQLGLVGEGWSNKETI